MAPWARLGLEAARSAALRRRPRPAKKVAETVAKKAPKKMNGPRR
jgi:hypothetical protein